MSIQAHEIINSWDIDPVGPLADAIRWVLDYADSNKIDSIFRAKQFLEQEYAQRIHDSIARSSIRTYDRNGELID